jgi:hypothetical protein
MTRWGRFLATFGNGQHGRLGHGDACVSELFARIVPGVGRDVKQVACGGAHTAVVTGNTLQTRQIGRVRAIGGGLTIKRTRATHRGRVSIHVRHQ